MMVVEWSIGRSVGRAVRGPGIATFLKINLELSEVILFYSNRARKMLIFKRLSSKKFGKSNYFLYLCSQKHDADDF